MGGLLPDGNLEALGLLCGPSGGLTTYTCWGKEPEAVLVLVTGIPSMKRDSLIFVRKGADGKIVGTQPVVYSWGDRAIGDHVWDLEVELSDPAARH